MVKRQYFAKLNGTASCQDGGAISRKSSLLGYVRLASVELQLNRFQQPLQRPGLHFINIHSAVAHKYGVAAAVGGYVTKLGSRFI